MRAPRLAALRTGSGAEAMNDESLAGFGVPLANARGRPPGSPDAICEERGPSSHVQYATGATAPAWFCQYRVIGVLSGSVPPAKPGRHPFAVESTPTAPPDRTHFIGPSPGNKPANTPITPVQEVVTAQQLTATHT